MVKMVPPQLPDNAQWFEKDLFEKLKVVPANWKVLANMIVDEKEDDTRPRELDFVIIIPKSYSVVYLEAKSGDYRYDQRQWLRRGEVLGGRTSPPEQVRSGMWALKNKFEVFLRQNPRYGSLQLCFAGAVAFSAWEVTDEAKNSEDINKGTLLIGSPDLKDGNSIVQSIGGYVGKMRQQMGGLESWNKQRRLFAEAQLRALEEMLNPSEIPITQDAFYRSNLETLLPELLKPTPDQATVLDLTGRNARCAIDGAAGTGKTVLAMEVARQRCEDDGEVVGLLCSNPNLSSRFEKWAETLSNEKGGKLLAGTPTTLLHSAFDDDEAFLSKNRERLEAAPNLEGTLKRGDLVNGWRGFVDETLADLEGKPPIFDYLIVDEAQNLCDVVFLKLMDQLLKGGLVNGRWAMFGDFVNQNIVTPRRENSGDAKASLDSFGAYYANVALRINCRNTHEIAAATYNITDIESPTLPGIHGPQVEFKYFDSTDQLNGMLDDQLNEWEEYGFESQQIVLLTTGENAAFDEKRRYGKWELVNMREVPPGGGVRTSSDDSRFVRYSEIHDFQGLESDLVILVLPITEGQTKVGGIITLPHHNYLNRLLYIAMSRANAMLVVMADEGYREHLEPIA